MNGNRWEHSGKQPTSSSSARSVRAAVTGPGLVRALALAIDGGEQRSEVRFTPSRSVCHLSAQALHWKSLYCQGPKRRYGVG